MWIRKCHFEAMRKEILFSVCYLIFSACADKDQLPTVEQQLQGAWQRKWVSFTQRWNFHDGACDAYSIVPAQPVQYYSLAYTFRGDTMTVLDLASGEKYKAVVSFKNDSTAVLSWEGGVDYYLKRI
jgi:hypothetical protein